MKNIFAKIFSRKYFQREERFTLKFMKMPVGSFVYRTNDILRLLGPGIAEMRKSAHFRYFTQRVRFELKCKKCFIFIFFTKNQLLRASSRNLYKTNAMLRLLGAVLLKMRFWGKFTHFQQKSWFYQKSDFFARKLHFY